MGCCASRIRTGPRGRGSSPALAVLLAIAVLLPGHARAQQPAHARLAAHPATAWDAGDAFAGRWGVSAGDVRVEWSASMPAVSTEDRVHIRGDGAGGRYIVELERADGTIQRTWVRAGVAVPVLRARVDIPRGTTLDSTHVARESSIAWGGPAYARPHDVLGWITRRPLAAGELLVEPAVAPPPAVTAGEDIRVLVQNGPVQLMVPGRALGTAAAGEQVRVRLATGRRMTGIAEADGVVVVDSMETGK